MYSATEYLISIVFQVCSTVYPTDFVSLFEYVERLAFSYSCRASATLQNRRQPRLSGRPSERLKFGL